MSADPNTPLFMLSDDDDDEYEDDPAVTQVKANLAAAERIQQEKAEQRRLEREEWKVQAEAEAERLTWEIEEAERQRRELEEVEIERLTWEKEKLEEEKRVEQRRAAALRGLEKAVSPPEAGPSQAPPQKLERTVKGVDQGLGIVIPEKNCTLTSMDADLNTYPILIPPAPNTFHFCHHPQPHHSQPYHAQSIIYHPSFIINGNSRY